MLEISHRYEWGKKTKQNKQEKGKGDERFTNLLSLKLIKNAKKCYEV